MSPVRLLDHDPNATELEKRTGLTKSELRRALGDDDHLRLVDGVVDRLEPARS